MILFRCDYAEGAHPEILKRLTETNFEQLDGYGNDPYTRSAKRKILEACNCPEGEVHLLVGGTQTNRRDARGLRGRRRRADRPYRRP